MLPEFSFQKPTVPLNHKSMSCLKFLVGCLCLVNFRDVKPIPLANSSLEDSWPSNLNVQFPYPTFAPVNIETCQARVYPTTTPLTVAFGPSKIQTVLNTGYNVVAYVNQPTTARVTGGVLGKDVYIYNRIYYYWNNDASGSAAGLVDGKGTPIQTANVFYNQKYGSFNNAVVHRDGIAILVYNVEVDGNIPNPSFTPFQHALQQIQKAGSSTRCANGGSTTLFYNILPLVKYYYAYPGSFTFIDNSAQLCSAIIIQFPTSFSEAIAYSQFQAFQNLRNAAGSTINAVLSVNAFGSRPLVESTGVGQVILPS